MGVQAADHPRSRGVYRNGVTAKIKTEGSSPLARGLHHEHQRDHRRPGIIPARAGFTRTPQGPDARRWDHPRSRGVYSQSTAACISSEGSSPLARGLHQKEWTEKQLSGIIPARAGFTYDGRDPLAEPTDHPRSRGVYNLPVNIFGALKGSSPLARGLPAVQIIPEVGVRIIPARAGFTRSSPHRSHDRQDHPRSRGVYPSSRQGGRPFGGSSPLARGLPQAVLHRARNQGIIPARAGFTPDDPEPGSEAGDHPRSRGVYSRATTSSRSTAGSSPLARGLPIGAQ